MGVISSTDTVTAVAAAAAVIATAASAAPPPLAQLVVQSTKSSKPQCPAGLAAVSGPGWDSDFNAGASGTYVFLCAGPKAGSQAITSLKAFSSGFNHTGLCPAGTEQLAGNMHGSGSKNKGLASLCVGHGAEAPIYSLVGASPKPGLFAFTCASTFACSSWAFTPP